MPQTKMSTRGWLVCAVTVVFWCQPLALGQENQIAFSVGLQTADFGPYREYVEHYPNLTYPPGQQQDRQYFMLGDSITWDVVIEASGSHSFGDGLSYPIQGVAHFGFDLQLRADRLDGPIVQESSFYSMVNPKESAAFPFNMSFYWQGLGRVIDPFTQGGPYMADYSYPAATYTGSLNGMQAGYERWNGIMGLETTLPGVGLADVTGPIAIAEGQIDTNILGPGIYYLACVPTDNNTILRGDVDLTRQQSNYALPAEAILTKGILFEVVDACPCQAEFAYAVSRRWHQFETFDIPVPLDGTAAIDPRESSGTTQFVVGLENLPASNYMLTCADIDIANGTCLSVVADNYDIVIDTSYESNACVEISLLDKTFRVITLEGDTTGDQLVNLSDLLFCKGRLFEPIDEENDVCDINGDSMINLVDLLRIKANLFAQAHCDTPAN